jgi:hypothetical protein
MQGDASFRHNDIIPARQKSAYVGGIAFCRHKGAVLQPAPHVNALKKNAGILEGDEYLPVHVGELYSLYLLNSFLIVWYGDVLGAPGEGVH